MAAVTRFCQAERSIYDNQEVSDDCIQNHSEGFLPMAKHRERFLSLLGENDIVMVIGETGSGKSTLLPQFLLNDRKHEWKGICVAEPRRLAATNLAGFVAMQQSCELGGSLVGYAIRHDNCIVADTRLVFTTVGWLLRGLMFNPLLEQYQVVILDEVHERSVDMDLAMGLIKKVMKHRSNLKLVLSSATPDIDVMRRFFPDMAVMTVQGRRHPVEIYHIENPIADYVEGVCKTVIYLNEEYGDDPGSILCFLPGQNEIMQARSILLDSNTKQARKLNVMTLYASMPRAKKLQAFRFTSTHSNKRYRKVVLATSIAETSLTIPDVVFVVDSGFTRMRIQQNHECPETLCTVPVSKQTAVQRAGRAGRLRSGKCFRLYPKTQQLESFDIPEICRVDLTSCYLLRLLAMGAGNLIKFEMPTPPSVRSVASGLDTLLALEMLDKDTASLTEPYGQIAAELPLDCRYTALLLNSDKMGCLNEMLDIVCAFSVKDIFVCKQKKLRIFGAKEGDVITVLNAVRAFKQWDDQSRAGMCAKHGLNYDACCRAMLIQSQLKRMLSKYDICLDDKSDDFSPTDVILKSLVSGLFKNIACLDDRTDGPLQAGSYSLILFPEHSSLKLHKHSVFHGLEPLPHYVVFHTLSEDNIMFEVSLVREAGWLHELLPHYFSYGTDRQLTAAQTSSNNV